MDGSTKRAILWQVVGFLFYLAGMVVFLAVAVSAFLAPPSYSFANITGIDVVALLSSVCLLVVGRIVSWKLGGGIGSATHTPKNPWRQHDQTPLEELGYHVPPDDAERPKSGYTYDDGELRVVCRECGTENEPEFTYCGNCSAELPE